MATATDTDDLPDLWERQPGETAKAYDQFCTYRDLGRGRTLAKVAEILARNTSWIRTVAAQRDWVRRASAWDREQDQVFSMSLVDRRRVMAERHASLASAFLNKVVQRLTTLEVNKLTPADTVRWLEVATKLERQALGAPTEHVQHTGPGGGPLEVAHLNDEQRRARLAELSAEVQRRLGVDGDLGGDPGGEAPAPAEDAGDGVAP
jgi:hypothetical protein